MSSDQAAAPAAPRRPGLPRGLGLALAVMLSSTLLCAALEPILDATNLLLVYTSGVVFVALKAGRMPALLATGLAILAFDVIHVPPRWSIKPTDPHYYFTFLLMAAFGWLVGELSMRLRAEIARSEGRAWRAQTLARLASRLAQARDLEAVIRTAQDAVRDATGRARILVRVAETGDTGPSGPRDLALPLRGAEGPLGSLVVHDMATDPGTLAEHLELLGAMADQTALAIERARFEHASVQARVQSETERLRSTLLASISHDFRTPLTTIVGSTTSLLEQWQVLDETRRQALLQGVLNESQRLHMLSSNLLELTRMERGMVRPNCEWCLADEVVNEAVASIGRRLAHHALVSRVPPDVVVWCDPRLVEQALVNLLENAARHTPAGTGVTIDVRTDAGEWSLAVADNGPGFPTGPGAASGGSGAPLPLFERSGAVSSGGLGLSICTAIAKLHGGRLSIESGAGAGAGVRILLSLPLPSLPTELISEAR